MQALLPASANSPGKYAIPAPTDMQPGLFNYHVAALPETLARSVLGLFTDMHKAGASCSSELLLVLLQSLEKGKGRPGKRLSAYEESWRGTDFSASLWLMKSMPEMCMIFKI